MTKEQFEGEITRYLFFLEGEVEPFGDGWIFRSGLLFISVTGRGVWEAESLTPEICGSGNTLPLALASMMGAEVKS